jgi:ATP-dependent Clp endopeptidase proteolytic subunit ClpP
MIEIPARPNNIQARDDRFSARALQLFAQAGLPQVLDVRAATATTGPEILVYDEIGPFGITSKAFATALAQAGDGDLTLRINSPGGDVFTAMNIYNAIKRRDQPVTCVVDGLAASAASLIAMAGDRIVMNDASMLMIHNSHTLALGDRHEMIATAEILAKVDDTLASIYAARSGASLEDVHAIMDRETWMTASEAISQNYCDEVVECPPQPDGMPSTKEMTCHLTASVAASAEEPEATDEDQALSAARELRLRRLRVLSAH